MPKRKTTAQMIKGTHCHKTKKRLEAKRLMLEAKAKKHPNR